MSQVDDFLEDHTYSDEPYGVEDLDPIGDRFFTLGVLPTASLEFRRYVFAAAKALGVGNRSVDYMLRTYGDMWDLRDSREQHSRAVLAATRDARRDSRSAIRKIIDYPSKPGRLGLFAALAALMRLQSTFRALTFTVRHGLTFETAPLLRLVVEQLAWCLAIHSRADEGIFDVKPQGSLRFLTAAFPETGKFYGELSETAHIHPDETYRYIEFEAEVPMIRMAFRENSHEDALKLLRVADYYIVVCELVGAELPLPRSAVDLGPPIQLRVDRPFLAVRKRHEKIFSSVSG